MGWTSDATRPEPFGFQLVGVILVAPMRVALVTLRSGDLHYVVLVPDVCRLARPIDGATRATQGRGIRHPILDHEHMHAGAADDGRPLDG